MSRILFWNIENFGINKIFNASASLVKRKQGDDDALVEVGLSEAQAAIDRYAVIKWVIRATVPDIFVIVELNSNQAPTPQLATGGSGIQGAEALLWWLRGQGASPLLRAQDPSWRLAPPLKVGTATETESVAVFYRGQSGAITRYFTGPNYWSGGPDGFSCLPQYAPSVAPYDAGEINWMLVPANTEARRVPATAAYCGGQMENTLAARVMFREAGDPDSVLNYGIYRPPYMVTFTEVTAGQVRNLTVFGVHTPPKMKAPDSYPEGYPAYLASTEDVIGAFRGQETRVIGGDFNLPLFKRGVQTDAYNPLLFNGYALLLASPNPAQQLNTTQQGYFSTSLRRSGTTGLWQQYYPGYKYFAQSYDNILIRRFDNAPTNPATVMNTIVGSPYQNAPTNPVDPPQLASLMRAPVINNWPPPKLNVPKGERQNLSDWDNFGYLRSTSDHLGVFADV